MDISSKARKKHPLVSSIAKRWLNLLTLVTPSGETQRAAMKSARSTLIKLNKVTNHTVTGNKEFFVDIRNPLGKRDTSLSLSSECRIISVARPLSSGHQIRTGVISKSYPPPLPPIPHFTRSSSPILGEKPAELEPLEEAPEELSYSPDLSPIDKMGCQFFCSKVGLYHAYLTTKHVRSEILHLLFLMQIVHQKKYTSYIDVPVGRGGRVAPGGWLYRSGFLGEKNSPMDELLLELIPPDTLFDAKHAVAICRIMSNGEKVGKHIDNSSYGPAVLFVTLQPSDPNNFNNGALRFSDNSSHFLIPSDPSKAFLFCGHLRSKWKHEVEPLVNCIQPRVTITYRLWSNEREEWIVKE